MITCFKLFKTTLEFSDLRGTPDNAVTLEQSSLYHSRAFVKIFGITY